MNRQDWDNPTELKEYSRNNIIWDTIREIYDQMIGQVNGSPLQILIEGMSLGVPSIEQVHRGLLFLRSASLPHAPFRPSVRGDCPKKRRNFQLHLDFSWRI